MKVLKRKDPKMVIPKKENFQKVFSRCFETFPKRKISFFGNTIFGPFLFKTFISAPILILEFLKIFTNQSLIS